MLESSMIYTVARTFPESFVVILCGMILLNKKIEIKELLSKGILFGIIVSGIRFLPINFGVHTILGMLALGVFLFSMSKFNLVKIIITTCMIWISLALSEVIYVLICTNIFNLDLTNLLDNRTLKGALITLPSLIITVTIVILIKKYDKKIVNIRA